MGNKLLKCSGKNSLTDWLDMKGERQKGNDETSGLGGWVDGIAIN